MNDTPHPAPTLEALARTLSGVQAIVLASSDGFALAQAGPRGNTADRLAAMTSSMLGLAGALGRELAFGDLDTLILEAAHGKVLMLAVPGPSPRLLMTACDHTCVIGNVLWHAKQCVLQLAATSDQ
ncbi:roadblock/LC7 domain-containing protein [Stenotrophomonas sp. 24(2023)]|uniref:roadblock/LC7 domain-containing protein n=1 Tax=Stenotrophomonas sp. 24(2023) TaxID=3068324 RepID=UPI0027E07773|nr:roadblock/LC7 domain-containing protein [Stenotrophomonas sp. 24(2023)]WMJ69895.1 roadblock/LC7 domain-containing protein [Stenotrophomonas sp. 24(2023)]